MRRHANVSVKGGKALEQSVSFFRKCNATVTYVNFEGCTKSAQSAVRAPAKFTQIQLGVGTFFAFVTLSQIMKIAYLTAGAAGMYCGSCMNDNAVARALIRSGHDCLLVPVYTPIRTDDDDVSVSRVFLGGINVYLQQQVGWMSRVPRFLDAILNQPWLIQWLTRDAGKTSPKLLGALTISMLRGFRGRQRKEFERLLQWLDAEVRPDVILLTNLLIGGAIPDLKARLKARVFVTIQGDDIFLDSLSPQDRLACETLMQELVEHVDGFFVHSHEYGAAMASRFMIPRSKWHVVPLGIATDEFPADAAWRQDTGQPQQPKTIGYLARMAPEKGLHKIVEALEQMLGSQASQTPLRLRLAGWMGPQHVPFWNEQRSRLDALAAEHPQFTWDYAGSVDRAGKLEFLRSLDLFCVPTVYAEPKGRFLLEAVCMGLPYVMPDHGAFPELHRRIQSRSGHPEGWLYRHDSINDLVNVVQQALLNNHGRRAVSEELLQELDINTHTSRLLSLLEIPANHP
jgi:glycosyltransferase involved in cell wall biosynthesis